MVVIMTVSCIPCAGSAIYAGALRGAGDTKAVAWITFWVVAIVRPLVAWILCYPFRLYQAGIWIAFTLAQTLRWIFLAGYYRKGIWKELKL